MTKRCDYCGEGHNGCGAYCSPECSEKAHKDDSKELKG